MLHLFAHITNISLYLNQFSLDAPSKEFYPNLYMFLK